jgi:hypothetical protein
VRAGACENALTGFLLLSYRAVKFLRVPIAPSSCGRLTWFNTEGLELRFSTALSTISALHHPELQLSKKAWLTSPKLAIFARVLSC